MPHFDSEEIENWKAVEQARIAMYNRVTVYIEWAIATWIAIGTVALVVAVMRL